MVDPSLEETVAFTCNGERVEVAAAPGESLLSVLREHLELRGAKDGCAPQGQCGCCTVLVDGSPRAACVTPATRVAGRSVTTVEGLDADRRERIGAAFVATGGSQCGFCTPGIIMRLVPLLERPPVEPTGVARALAAHLCRCTGWRTVVEAATTFEAAGPEPHHAAAGRDLLRAAERAALEGGVPQHVGLDVPVGALPFADDVAPHGALVAMPRPPGSDVPGEPAAGLVWVLGDSPSDARARAGAVPGRRTTVDVRPPLPLPLRPDGGVRLATSWVEPAYLEPDASWCEPGGEPASPLANGGAFGGKARSPVGDAARELAGRLGRPVRVLFSREDCVRLGPKRPPIAAAAAWRAGVVEVDGTVLRDASAFVEPVAWPYAVDVRERWRVADRPGPPVGPARAVGLAERVVLVEGALAAGGADRAALARDARVGAVLLDVCAPAGGRSRALAGARVELDPTTGAPARVHLRVAAGDPLDEVVLRSYCVGAAHMALGWVLTEGLAVDPETGEVHDLTIRSFGIVRARDMPPVDLVVVDDAGPAQEQSSDAVFAAVAAATWNVLATAEAARPESFPARDTRAAGRMRR